MAAVYLAKQARSALAREKPHSSITDLVEILTSPTYEDEAFDGIPELVESINLQPTGPAEASRAIRKKLKYGDPHRQYRALVLLKAAVENCGDQFLRNFADDHLVEVIKHVVSDPSTDPKVKKKLTYILASWHREYKGDPRMTVVANLYKQRKQPEKTPTTLEGVVHREVENTKRKREEKEAKQKAKEQKLEERKRREEEERKRAQRQSQPRRPPFNFEKEKPQILNAIAETSQAANNLINALTLVNTEHDTVKDNERVQECLEAAKQARKRIVRYIQLVENEDLIGTLIETNERIITALETYDKLSNPEISSQDVEDVQAGLAAVNLHGTEVGMLQQRQRAAVERTVSRSNRARAGDGAPPVAHGDLHPDLQDLNFGALGAEQSGLPPPIRPSAPGAVDDDAYEPGTLSDFSDYESSDEDTHNQRYASTSTYQHHPSTSTAYATGNNNFVTVSDDENLTSRKNAGKKATPDDPFADPFAD